MAFKTFSQYQEDKNGEFFVLPNDKDTADVIFLYRSTEDVLVADVHYLTTSTYKGYVHCCESGCPACNYGERGIQVQHKIFVPLYNLQKNKIEFWDRSTFFEQQLQRDVFTPFPNPSEAIFRITRNGEAGSRDTKYSIVPVYRNSSMPYEKILADCNTTFPEGYSVICRDMPASEMYAALNSSVASSDLQDYGYVPVPRGTNAATEIPEAPAVPTPEYSAPPEVAPPVADTLPGEPLPEFNGNAAESADDSGDSLDDVKF